VTAPATIPKGDLRRILQMGGVLSFHVLVEDLYEPGVGEMLERMSAGGVGTKTAGRRHAPLATLWRRRQSADQANLQRR
jgi:hypothetical protein